MNEPATMAMSRFFSFAAYSHTTPRGKNAVHRHACRLASSDRAFADAAPTSLAVFAAFFAAAFSSLLADDASTRFACNASLLARFSPTRNSEHCPGTRPSSAHNVASPACRRFQLRLASLRLGLGLLERRLQIVPRIQKGDAASTALACRAEWPPSPLACRPPHPCSRPRPWPTSWRPVSRPSSAPPPDRGERSRLRHPASLATAAPIRTDSFTDSLLSSASSRAYPTAFSPSLNPPVQIAPPLRAFVFWDAALLAASASAAAAAALFAAAAAASSASRDRCFASLREALSLDACQDGDKLAIERTAQVASRLVAGPRGSGAAEMPLGHVGARPRLGLLAGLGRRS